MSKELVKLPKEVAEAIQNVRNCYISGCEYDLEFLAKEKYGSMGVITMFVDRSRENIVRYFQALVNGYEVEETPESELKNWYQGLKSEVDKYTNWSENVSFITREMEIIEKVLDVLNIKIEGVNA